MFQNICFFFRKRSEGNLNVHNARENHRTSNNNQQYCDFSSHSVCATESPRTWFPIGPWQALPGSLFNFVQDNFTAHSNGSFASVLLLCGDLFRALAFYHFSSGSTNASFVAEWVGRFADACKWTFYLVSSPVRVRVINSPQQEVKRRSVDFSVKIFI